MKEQRIEIDGESYRVYIEAESDGQAALAGMESFIWVRRTLNGPELFVNCIPEREAQIYDSTSLDGTPAERRRAERRRLDGIEERLAALEAAECQ